MGKNADGVRGRWFCALALLGAYVLGIEKYAWISSKSNAKKPQFIDLEGTGAKSALRQ